MNTDLVVTIVPGLNRAGHYFTQIFYRWFCNGEPRCALTRVPYKLNPDRHTEAQERQHFMRRQGWNQ